MAIISVSIRYVPEYFNRVAQCTCGDWWECYVDELGTMGGKIIGNSRQECIDLVVSALREYGLHGTLKVS